jgi:tRNA uridine 5-carbamoylmethylation protein Kti12
MEKVIKISQETLQNIKNLQQQYIHTVHQIGDIEIGIKNLQEAKETALNQYKKLKNDEKNIIDEIGKNYGYGKLDLERGELTINVDETEQKQ